MSQSDIKKFLEGLLVIYQICENVEESKVKETTSNKNLSLFVRLVFFVAWISYSLLSQCSFSYVN